ncbi:hypothetical protein HMPREF9622_00472 [Cutibacterium modestum HL037PA3]|uniref:Uncharacterized protein n=1 Tax=Cutibacterium modestum HL044PA1 TaxID=765109 RepID=A0ABN0C789_9ACTN|nr:hypothetical protein HMPREF9621_02121 [Cutibacterium modestum HL037PA2]EFS93052.1 hypothetical protein HMPREF9607_00684 [Cutibacterium modestum HL044PA1]EFT16481.1 hypothetical protein HMPREF9622_00472 [Cutibacterium modestum HL037PA3]
MRPPVGCWDLPDERCRLLGVVAIVVHLDTTVPATPRRSCQARCQDQHLMA